MKVSIVTPIHNESANIAALVRRIADTMDAWRQAAPAREWEQLACDDHSTDDSIALLNALKKDFPRLRVLKNPRRSGQTGGFQTGFANATGDVIVTMDADLQNPPEEIPALLQAIEVGRLELVNAIRARRQHASALIAISRLGNVLIQWCMTCPVSDAASNFMAVKAEYVRNLALAENDHRYIIPICVRRGLNPARIGEIATRHDARQHGASKYSALRKALTGFPELLRCRQRLQAGFYDCAGRFPSPLGGEGRDERSESGVRGRRPAASGAYPSPRSRSLSGLTSPSPFRGGGIPMHRDCAPETGATHLAPMLPAVEPTGKLAP